MLEFYQMIDMVTDLRKEYFDKDVIYNYAKDYSNLHQCDVIIKRKVYTLPQTITDVLETVDKECVVIALYSDGELIFQRNEK